ncbi:MAG TPA: ribulose-phosphate 3-epimerase [Candidatus Dormibacteraeota bacterium]|nr:ribulose-phosphate 3-epimerase [Candidatus Dormibacteraeota bacterium]
MTRRVEIVPSILSADFLRLGEQVREAEAAGADRIQVDVMDGHFVPNLTMGPAILKAVRSITKLPLEAHLMVESPERWVDAFAEAGADVILVQVESTTSLYRTVTAIKAAGARPGVVINPATSVESIREILPYVDQVLVMTVEPGFGGQHFVPGSPEKVLRVRELAPDHDLEVDGGIDADTARLAVEAGANLLVAGSSVYGFEAGVAAGIAALREAADRS